MKAIVLYQTKHGNTESIARSIVKGMQMEGFEDVVLVNLRNADEDDLKDRDIWILGCPTHWGSASYKFRILLTNAMKYHRQGKRAAVFDTRFEKMGKGASDKLSDMLSSFEIPLVTGPAHFKVSSVKGPLIEGEDRKAEEFGREIVRRSG
jgi:flavodoxin